MIQKNEVLTREDNALSLTCATRTTAKGGCLTVTEREIPVNTTEQTWTFEVGEKTRAGRATPSLVNTLVKMINWLNHLGTGKIADSRLEARHNIHHNIRTKGIGL